MPLVVWKGDANPVILIVSHLTIHSMMVVVKLQSCCLVQAAQLRKSSFVQPGDVPESQPAAYDADKQNYCTVYSGTFVQQVSCPINAYMYKREHCCSATCMTCLN